MTTAERATYFRQVRRVLRDDQVRHGTRRPSTMREMEIWREGNAEREKWRTEMIAEAERRQARRVGHAERGRSPDPPV